MKILFVAMAESVHTARWISMIADQGWDLHLFPSIDNGVTHPDLKNISIYHSFYGKQRARNQSVSVKGIPVISPFAGQIGRDLSRKLFPDYRNKQLHKIIHKLNPDIIHSMEFQASGYLTFDAREQYGGKFPTWIATNWGSDIYLFGRLPEHVNRIKSILEVCDYYSCECFRDIQIAKDMGLKGQILPVLPNTGGFDLTRIEKFKQPGLTSARRLVVLKGYQGWAGRALVGLRAIELCADLLKGSRIAIYLASNEVELAAKLVSQSTGIPIEIIPPCSHEEILRLHGRARISIGLSISDAISTSFLETIAMGSFPIQSNTSCANEWITNCVTGILVHPEDPAEIAAAIRLAITNDSLVDEAAKRNAKTVSERLDLSIVKPQVIKMYEEIVSRSRQNGIPKNKKS
jgi:glycosyltransferase involved in cell wall biosynthesis